MRLSVDRASSIEELVAAFLAPPLPSTHYRRAFGTVYAAVYRPADGSVRCTGRAWAGGPHSTIRTRSCPSSCV
jgi:hypothetical protein